MYLFAKQMVSYEKEDSILVSAIRERRPEANTRIEKRQLEERT